MQFQWYRCNAQTTHSLSLPLTQSKMHGGWNLAQLITTTTTTPGHVSSEQRRFHKM